MYRPQLQILQNELASDLPFVQNSMPPVVIPLESILEAIECKLFLPAPLASWEAHCLLALYESRNCSKGQQIHIFSNEEDFVVLRNSVWVLMMVPALSRLSDPIAAENGMISV